MSGVSKASKVGRVPGVEGITCALVPKCKSLVEPQQCAEAGAGAWEEWGR